MEKDAKSKGKGKTQTKRVKGRKCSIEEQDVQGIDGQTKSLCCFQQGFFLCLTKWTGVIVKSFHAGIFVKCVM